jgi:pyridinium-3,5-biscarboxylic acid mononucleotide synthase
MTEAELRTLLGTFKTGVLSESDAVRQLAAGPFRHTQFDFAVPDHHRYLRHGLSEVIYAPGKSVEQILALAKDASSDKAPVLITRLHEEKVERLREVFPDARYNVAARTATLHAPVAKDLSVVPDAGTVPHVAIVAAGTSDLPVAEEVLEVCVAMDVPFVRLYDVGVAGLHRILSRTAALQAATALVVVAGMEGALPSVVGGLVAPRFSINDLKGRLITLQERWRMDGGFDFSDERIAADWRAGAGGVERVAG